MFFEEKIQSRIRDPISHRKGYIHFCRMTIHSLKNGRALPKIFFRRYFRKYCCFFFEKIVI